MRLSRLAIFPLPEVQLFPHSLLPLHVFEPRYRTLARDCLAGSRRFAIATLEPGYEDQYEGRPPVKSICGLGEIVAHHHRHDGRYDLLLHGTARLRILEELNEAQPYRLVNAEVLDDLCDEEENLVSARDALIVLCDRLATVLPSGGETLRSLARQESDPSATADLVAAAVVTDPVARQELIEMLDVATRIERVSTRVLETLAELRPPAPSN